MHNPEYDAAIAQHRLASALFLSSLTVTGMAAGMEEWNETHEVPADADPVPEVIVNLFTGCFETLVQRHGIKRVKQAAQILEQAHEIICEDIFVVSDELLEEWKAESEPEP